MWRRLHVMDTRSRTLCSQVSSSYPWLLIYYQQSPPDLPLWEGSRLASFEVRLRVQPESCRCNQHSLANFLFWVCNDSSPCAARFRSKPKKDLLHSTGHRISCLSREKRRPSHEPVADAKMASTVKYLLLSMVSRALP
jgi:hypothetical protein